jgi:hypothetical protein
MIQGASLSWYLLHAGILIALFFDPEDGGDMFLRNFRWFSTDCTTLQPRRQTYKLTHTAHCPSSHFVEKLVLGPSTVKEKPVQLGPINWDNLYFRPMADTAPVPEKSCFSSHNEMGNNAQYVCQFKLYPLSCWSDILAFKKFVPKWRLTFPFQ